MTDRSLKDRLKDDEDLPPHVRAGRETLRKQQEKAEKTEKDVALKDRVSKVTEAENRKKLAKEWGASDEEIAQIDESMGTKVDPGEFRPTVTGKHVDGTKDEDSSLFSKVSSSKSTTEKKGGDKTPPPKSLKDTVAAAAGPSGPEKDPYADLGKELENARGEYKAEKDNLGLRESIEAIANGLGKIGAGMYGNKKGTDMSGVKFDKQDWDKKRDHAQGDYRTSLEDVSTRRKEQIARDQAGKDGEHRDKVLKETTRHNKVMESVYGAKAVEAGKSAVAKLDSKAAAAYQKGVKEVSKKIGDVSKQLADGGDEDLAMESLQGILVSDLKLSPEAARAIVVDEGWFDFTTNMKDLSSIQAEVNKLASTQMVTTHLKSKVPKGQMLVQSPEGEYGYVAEGEELDEGYKLVP